ncbi:MAG: hypothetical protein ACN6O8_25780 [Achromobacter sp.]|uniref:hypothetical protein n=1 Tax=Achromobacter sp. TaxID=134375 RepID=UPI003D009DD6
MIHLLRNARNLQSMKKTTDLDDFKSLRDFAAASYTAENSSRSRPAGRFGHQETPR